MSDISRVPPQSIEAEKGVLGSVLLDSRVLDDVAPIVGPEDFYRDAHQKICRAILDMHAHGVSGIDTLTLTERLRSAGVIDEIGGAAYLGELLSAPPHAGNAAYYASIVRDKALRRELIHHGNDAIKLGYSSGAEDAESLLQEAESGLLAIRDRRHHASLTTGAEELHRLLNDLDQEKPVRCGVFTGFAELDLLTGGLLQGSLAVIAGRPSMGKTALVLTIIMHVLREGGVVLLVSLEQSRREIILRLTAGHAGIPSNRLNNLMAADKHLLTAASRELTGPLERLAIDDGSGATPRHVAAMARRTKRRCGRLDVVCIDYLQLMTPPATESKRRDLELAGITSALKALARERDVPVVLLAQLNRDVERRDGHRPRLCDLRDSGAIEQDADLVMLLHRPGYYEPSNGEPRVDARETELIVAKQRNGKTDTVKLSFRSELMRFDGWSY